MKAKIGRSPDRTDGFVLTFSQAVPSKSQALVMPAWAQKPAAYDPFASMLS